MRIYLGTSSSLHLKLIKKSLSPTLPRREGEEITYSVGVSSLPYGGRYGGGFTPACLSPSLMRHALQQL